ncbi:polymorphic toxin-type HINT domain-containing protein [Streptomyces sudanensis]|uniref:polymorphic toxin-type HINT domain-containing protein n=1 Tax=Streptomyces sudanensis TaxID=436397 RepID=UPI0020CC5204|nr:polymorphic toxin-type HINT domain-containing protein [Streptomyces sudanensis]MCP9959050.1 hypothetical protein [Streptomyces sudanensis]MCQ0000484.1 hypothetical protein [Streptomyces sudanensis]
MLAWNDQGKLAKVTEAGGGETTYLYDAGGNRIQRKDPTGTTVYLPGMELKLSADGTKTGATRYYTFAGQTVAVRTDDNKVSFVASDHHGTGEVAVDSATGAVSQRRFDPYGVERGQATGTWPGERGYVGGTLDKSTGLTHLGAREYDPVIGKFISVDPLIDYLQPQQMNGYAYANNSPVTHSDPSGLILPECWFGQIRCSGGRPITGAAAPVAEAEQEVQEADNAVQAAQTHQSSTKRQIKKTVKALVKIIKDELGINAAFDCVSSGDMAACGETLLNIAGSFAGGMAGKLLAKYGLPWNLEKGYALGKKVAGLVDDLIGGVKDYFKAGEALKSAQGALSKAQDKLAAARKKATAALRKGGEACEANHSFLPGTLVLLADGTSKPIEEVRLGDKLAVTDPETGETTVREVAGTIVTEDDKHFVDLTVEGENGEPEALVSTTTHPFWVESENRWIEAGDLRPGMELRTPDGDAVPVKAVHRFDERQRTHDLTLTEIHTYYVVAGATPVLVHNDGGEPVTDDFNQARNQALDWLSSRGFKAEKVTLGKFGTIKGKPVGMQTANGKTGFRSEFDDRSGAHINVWAGKEKGPHFQFNATEATVTKLQGLHGCG